MDDSLSWRKASYSGSQAECVEVAASGDGQAVFVRDTKDRGGPVHRYPAAEWHAFVAGVRAGEFDSGPLP